MYAIIETGGKQYKVSEGSVIRVEKIQAEVGEVVDLGKVMALVEDDGEVVAGTPCVSGAKVTATVLKHGKGPKILVFKYKPKTNYRKKKGHRQPFSSLRVEKIEASYDPGKGNEE